MMIITLMSGVNNSIVYSLVHVDSEHPPQKRSEGFEGQKVLKV